MLDYVLLSVSFCEALKHLASKTGEHIVSAIGTQVRCHQHQEYISTRTSATADMARDA